MNSKGATLARVWAGWGKCNMICLRYPLRDSAILFSFRTITTNYHKTLIGGNERATRALSRHCERSEQPMRSVSRE